MFLKKAYRFKMAAILMIFSDCAKPLKLKKERKKKKTFPEDEFQINLAQSSRLLIETH